MRNEHEQAVASALIHLMRGVVYRVSDETTWGTLERHRAAVRDHFAQIGVQVVVDEAEGYAYLSTLPDEEGPEPLPRLVRRHSLSYPVSLLLVLLRKRLAEFEAGGGDGALVLTREQIVELLRLFLPDSSNEARIVDQVDTTIRKVVELDFLRPLRGQRGIWEVRRILKAYLDAQTLSDFETRFREYAQAQPGAAPPDGTGGEDD